MIALLAAMAHAEPVHTRVEFDAGASGALVHVNAGGPEHTPSRLDLGGGVHGAVVLGGVFLASFDVFGGEVESPVLVCAGTGLAFGSPLRQEASFRFVHDVAVIGGDGTTQALVPYFSAEHGGDLRVELDVPLSRHLVVGAKAGWGRLQGLHQAVWAGPSFAWRMDRRFDVLEPRLDLFGGRAQDGQGVLGAAVGITIRKRLGEFDPARVGPTLPRLEDER